MQRPKERAELPALYLRKHAEHKSTKDDAAYRKKACQKQRAIQTAYEGVISGTRMTPKSIKKEGFQRQKRRVYMPGW